MTLSKDGINKEWCRKLRSQRLQLGLSRKQFSEKLGYAESSIKDVEFFRRNYSLAMRRKYKEVFGGQSPLSPHEWKLIHLIREEPEFLEQVIKIMNARKLTKSIYGKGTL